MKIGQLDGNQTTEYGTDEEKDPEPIPANLFSVQNQNIAPG